METTNTMQIEVLKHENEELRKLLKIQEGKLDRAMFAIYHLHDGLYNKVSQQKILDKKNALLYGQPLLEIMKPLLEIMIYSEEKTEEQEFTTRQGDRNELRIRQMEQTINMLERKIESFESKINNIYITHSHK